MNALLGNIWSIALVVLALGGSIFVHELGHFLAARRRGLKVERFSIGFGPALWRRRGKDGVEYRVSVLPFGGYVALPQLADLSALEGETETDISTLPPPGYATKMIVFVAGAFFNVLFALTLACVIWLVGLPTISELSTTTQIGYVAPTLKLADGTSVTSPAAEAGLKPGDVIVSIDGRTVNDFEDVITNIFLGHDHASDGRRQAVLVINRNGVTRTITVYPQLVGEEQIRGIGIGPSEDLTVDDLLPGYPAAGAGVKPGDVILAVDNLPVFQRSVLTNYLGQHAAKPVEFLLRRDGREIRIPIQSKLETDERTHHQIARVGIRYRDNVIVIHPNPFRQLADDADSMFRTLGALFNHNSDIGLSKLSGPVGMARALYQEAQWDFRRVLTLTVLINVSLAILNLLPIPVLDGGQMLFATVARLRGRALPLNFVAATQSVFMVLLLSLMLYVLVFGDIRRWVHEPPADAPPAADPAKKPEAAPVPAHP
ncbi:MAG TPA: RIP metalloprotease RseP [Candidatus Didemnitutus sp.]|nr:RIP metalloprotease RseP [Candidatus Didemnitutus sp.]